MRTLLWMSLVIGLAVSAPFNKEYSYKAFPTHGLSFKEIPAEDFNGTEIRGAQFYQEWQEGDAEVVKDIFPDGMTGVTFIDCNLDNVLVLPGNFIVRGINRIIKVQNDLDDWELDGALKPVEPLNKDDRITAGQSVDPKDIPAEKITEEEHMANQKEIQEAKE